MIEEPAESPEQEVFYAPPLQRLIAFILDLIAINTIIAFGLLSFATDIKFSAELNEQEVMEQVKALQANPAIFWISIAVYVLYFGLFQASKWQATPAKKLFDIYVTNLEGERLALGQSLWRALIETSNFLLLYGIPAILALFHPYGQAAHDVIARTYALKR